MGVFDHTVHRASVVVLLRPSQRQGDKVQSQFAHINIVGAHSEVAGARAVAVQAEIGAILISLLSTARAEHTTDPEAARATSPG